MGRTNTTYRDLLRAMESRWQEYRRALRHADQAIFDRLFEYARAHADASGVQNHQLVETYSALTSPWVSSTSADSTHSVWK